MTAPGIVIAAPESGVGKTTFTAGLCRALTRRGVRVQPFKAGPDFIDPSYHTLAAGRECRNLDGFLTSSSMLPFLYARGCAGADIAVIEGVMGLYDGIGSEGRNSTASLARALSLPVVLLLDATKGATSLAATALGFATLSTTEEGRRVPPPSVVGVILCGLREGELKTLISEAVERFAGLPVLGSIRQVPEAHFPSRHLGLIPAAERSELSLQLERLADAIDEGVSLERLTALAKAPSIPAGAAFPPEVVRVLEAPPRQSVRIAVARDKVFTFYYRDGLELLEELGAELLETSPAADAALPEEIDGLYLGGGYPEEFLGELAGNESYLADLRRRRVLGLPVYAECGGMMYLAREITGRNGERAELAGLLDLSVIMTGRLRRFGYVEARLETETLLASRGEVLRGHEFHYSEGAGETPAAYLVRRASRPEVCWNEGYVRPNLLASYVHLHFWGCPGAAARFVDTCRNWRNAHVR